MRRVLTDLETELEVVTGAAQATAALARKKYDAVLVDCDDVDGAPGVLANVRQAASNRTAIVFAIVNGVTTAPAAFEMGANFVLDKPLGMERVARSLKAAHGLIERERRRYFRHPADLPVDLISAAGEHRSGKIANVSEGGMAIALTSAAPSVGNVRVKFQLPGSDNAIETKAEIAWTEGEGRRVGVRFLGISAQAGREITRWLAAHAERRKAAPLFVDATRGTVKA